jgi:glycosyltransferase involved in cell wall biosynthesis
LFQRRLERADTVVYWAIDFVPDRFGSGLTTRAYDRLDAWCCRRADARFEVSVAALEGRNARHGLGPDDLAPARAVPIGAWTSRVPRTPPDGWRARKVIFLGHLVPRQGVGRLLDALGILARRGVEFEAEIAGHGPLLDELQAATSAAGISDRVRFLGYVSRREELERFVASASVAVAPYDTTVESFTRYADPSKIRAYMAGGVPVVLTDVPPNAAELAREGGAEVVAFGASAIAAAIERAMEPDAWQRRRAQALAYMQSFDWEKLLSDALGSIGFG